MVVYTVFSQNISTNYKTTLCSKSTFFLIVITVFTFLIPLLLAYRSQGFWIKSLSYREQPKVHFKYEYFLYMETNLDLEPIICATLRHQSEYLEPLDHCTSIKYNEEDFNGDGKLDKLSLELEVALRESQIIQSVFLVLAFDYRLQHHCLLEMEALAVIQDSISGVSSKLQVLGDLELVQRSLLHCRGRDLRYNQSAFSDPYINIHQLVIDHALQNVSTRFQKQHHHWSRRPSDKFTLQVDLIYPETTIHYRPGLWPVMKWAWVQYFSLLVIFLVLLRWVKSYVFLNRLLPTIPVRSWKKLFDTR